MYLGDMNLDGEANYGDVPAFFDQFFGRDDDDTRHLLADMDEDGIVGYKDANIFLNLIFWNEGR